MHNPRLRLIIQLGNFRLQATPFGVGFMIAHFPFGAADLTHLPAREA